MKIPISKNTYLELSAKDLDEEVFGGFFSLLKYPLCSLAWGLAFANTALTIYLSCHNNNPLYLTILLVNILLFGLFLYGTIRAENSEEVS